MTLRTPHRHLYYDGPQDGRCVTNEHAPLVVDFETVLNRNPQPGESVLERIRRFDRNYIRLIDRYMLESKTQDCEGVFVCRYRHFKTMPLEGAPVA